MIYDVRDTLFYTFLRHSWSLTLLPCGVHENSVLVSVVAHSLAHPLLAGAPLSCWRCVSQRHAQALYGAAMRCQTFVRGSAPPRCEMLADDGVRTSLVVPAQRLRCAAAIKRVVAAVEDEHARVRNAIAHDTLDQYLNSTHLVIVV